MARGTEWTEMPGGSYLGLGQRLLTTNDAEYALMDVRIIALNSPEDADAPQPDPEPTAQE